MEKEPQPESMATVTIKPEYTPSEYSTSEPPPAYMKPRSTSVQITKIVAVTIVLCSVILGGFLLASAYVTANASCKQLEQELDILSEAAERFQSPLQPEALIQDSSAAPTTNFKRQVEPLNSEAPSHITKELTNNIDDDSSESDSSEDSEELPIKETKKSAALPIEMNDLITHLLEKNQKSKMNCVVEKKKAEEFVDHQPRTVSLPFGINLTTNPRFEKLIGERMVIICESGTMQNAEPSMKPKEENEDDEDNDDEDEETIMIHPIMIPIPQTQFQTHMPQQMAPMPQQRPEQMRPIIQIETFRPSAPSMRPSVPSMRPSVPSMRPSMMPQQQPQEQIQMRPQIQIHVQPQQPQQAEFPPNPILQHIVRQIVAQKIMESQRLREQQLREQQEEQQQQQQVPSEVNQEVDERPRFVQIEQIGQPIGQHRFPLPEEILTQLNRLPNREVIVAVPDNASEEPQQDVQYVQQQRESANEMNGRQSYSSVPMSIPVGMTHDQEATEPEQQATDERHHYVQPRSV
ncbi:putative mediator of RNA polymerase II transcription subunit 12 [Diorhabda sublineata]|uniref:putative mediator of RNA polymerase II transcription subunit 12 n=1 Tax=Diorhabda sublineata TaxID=1163346 RepID=UPI0024E0DC21|nr:putative mediator of RNA polymerase II transcription subunit 12 [Diorhabda sublineata]